LLNVALGLGWNITTNTAGLSASVSPFGFEWHFLDRVSGMLSLPFTITPGGAQPTSVTFGPTLTFTWNAVSGGRPAGR
jgi:hypothetical protein